MVALGVASRSLPVQQVAARVVAGRRADQPLAACDPTAAAARVVAGGGTPPGYEYLFDPSRPQSVLARSAVDDQLQRAAGRQDPAAVTIVPVDEPGGRYIDFLVPGLLGMGLMGGGMWGVRF